MKTIDKANITGQAIIELVIVLPLLVMLMLAAFDFSRAIHTNNMISNMSREGANLASRTTLTKQQIMNTLAYTAQPLKMQNYGMIYITVIKGTGSASTPVINSQEKWLCNSTTSTTACSQAAIVSRIGTPGTTNPNPAVQNLGTFTLPANETAYVVEVYYNYQSLFSSNTMKLTPILYSKTIL